MSIKNFVNKLSVGQKVMTVIIVEVLSYSMVTTFAISQIHAVSGEVSQMANLYLPLFSSTENIRQQIQEGRLNLKDIIFVGNRVVYDKEAERKYLVARTLFNDGNQEINREISSAENLINASLNSQEEKYRLIEEYSDALLWNLSEIRQVNRINKIRIDKVFRHVEDGSFLMGMELLDEVSASDIRLASQLDSLVNELVAVKKASVAYAVRVEKIAARYTIIVSFLTVCFVIMVIFLIVRRNISNPLHMLTDVISSFDPLAEVNESDYERNIMERGDELGMLGRSFSRLKHDLVMQRRALYEAKEVAEKANQAKTKFLAAASHDLRQPLHAMRLYIEALKKKITDKDALSIMVSIDAVSDSTSRLLDALLDVSQLEAGIFTPQFGDFPINDILQRVVQSYRHLANLKGLELRMVSSTAIVHSDSILLERVIDNFLSNAVRYTQSGSILLGCRHRGNKLSIEVLDTGPGVSKDKQSVIFEDFYQIHNKERDRSKGLGLGLSIVRRLSACLNHKIEHSSVVGRGSRFAVIIDCSFKPYESIVNEVVLEIPGLDFDYRCVLLVEDDFEAMDATRQLLELWGFTVLVARSVDIALEKVQRMENRLDIIIADYRLPDDLTGVDAIASVQELLGYEVPAFIVTGEAETNNIYSACGMEYHVLRKPVRPAKMRTLMSFLLNGSAQSTITGVRQG
jgi:signal transduction histidine kinase/CheY-like chemotaxis protein